MRKCPLAANRTSGKSLDMATRGAHQRSHQTGESDHHRRTEFRIGRLVAVADKRLDCSLAQEQCGLGGRRRSGPITSSGKGLLCPRGLESAADARVDVDSVNTDRWRRRLALSSRSSSSPQCGDVPTSGHRILAIYGLTRGRVWALSHGHQQVRFSGIPGIIGTAGCEQARACTCDFSSTQ